MAKSRSYSVKSVKSTKSTKSQAISLSSSIHSWKKHGFGAIPTRYIVIFISLLANTFSYTCRTNMSVTIVAMVNNTHQTASLNYTTSDTDTCPVEFVDTNSTETKIDKTGNFVWSSTMQGHILGSFYYGYIATNINGGQLAEWFGVRWLCGLVTLISAILTGLTPIFAYWSPIALILLRVVTGLAQGILTPAIYAMLANWVPRHERGVVLALIQVGGNIGAVLTLPLSGFLSNTDFLDGWPSVFYVLGFFGCLCFILWMCTVYDSPEQHPRIRRNELTFIQENITISLAQNKKDLKKEIPWIPIFLSMPMWAVAVAKFCGAWGNLMLMSKLPTYLESVLNMPIELNGVISAVVYIALSISLTFFGFVSDFVGKKRLINETLSRKIFESIALGGPGICLALIPWIRCNQTGVIVILVLALTIFGLNAGGDKPIVVDIAPDHSGTIYGITNAIASLPGILAPLFVGMIINDTYGSLTRWSIVFYSATGVYIFGMLFFIIFGTAKAQPWGISAQRSRRCTSVSKSSSRRPSKVPSRGTSRAPSRAPSAPASPITERKKASVFNLSQLEVGNQFEIGNENNHIQNSVYFRENNVEHKNEPDENGQQEEGQDEDEEFNDEYDQIHFKERRFSIFPIP